MVSRPPRILAIEDDPQIRRVLRTGLLVHGFDLYEAESGEAGLREARAREPELVILDLGLPDLDGLTLIGRLRSRPSQEILVLSARGEESQKVRALDAGADDFLVKPFDLPELLARVRVALRRAAQAQAPPGGPVALPSIGVTVDVARHRVQRDGQAVHLTPIEFKILAVLLRHGGRILTHEQLLLQVWGEGQEANRHYLRIYVGGLRRKLEPEPARPRALLSVPGVGYRLVAEAET